ncbi:FecR family protein [Solitalea koreensis]|nr:FecR domain-containing protein [Solitalea koreensis]
MNNNIDNLIINFLQGTLSESGQDDLNNWIIASDKNRALFEKLTSQKWINTELESFYQYNEDKGWDKVVERLALNSSPIAEKNFESPKIGMLLLWKRIAVAASVLLVMGVGSYFLLLNKFERRNEIVKTIKPAKNIEAPIGPKAMITLANGNKLYLDKVSKGALAIQENVKVMKLADGQIVYSSNASNGNQKVVPYNTLTNPRGSADVINMTLSDGTKVWLNADTRLKYPVSFDGSANRVVYLESGEIYFKVTKNPSKPFIVHNGDMSIQVLGTSFNVNAYSGIIYTTLVEGKVKVDIKNTSELQLIPGQQAQFDRWSGALEKQEVDVFPYVAWKEGILAFDNTTLESLMEQVGRLYDYDIEFKDSELKQLHFNGRMEKTATVIELLDIIQKTTNVKFNLKDRRIIIEKTTR